MEINDDAPKPEETVTETKAEREALMLKAMAQVVRLLEPLPMAARRRVLRGAMGFYEIKPDDNP